jgi:hypothetical protein
MLAFRIEEAHKPFVDVPSDDELSPEAVRVLAHGFSQDEVKQIIGFAAFRVMNTLFSASALVALTDE